MDNSWLLAGARVARSARRAERLDIEIRSGRIAALRPPGKATRSLPRLDLRGCMILPGLINAHDHLEFNLFPRLGRGPYSSAAAWARAIHRPEQSPVREQLRVPLPARLRWGGIKNLLDGVTTVCHHNPYEARVFGRDFPVRVHKNCGWAHSLEFDRDLLRRFRATPAGRPFILHLAESVDGTGAEEIMELDAGGALCDRTVLVHGVGLGEEGLRLARERGGALVWCPGSNLFILGRTLGREVFESGIPIALGTDSALSCAGGLLDEIRLARRLDLVSPERLYGMVTSDAARILRLENGEGTIDAGVIADLLAVRDVGKAPAATLQRTDAGAVELVLLAGRVQLVSSRLAPRFPSRLLRVLEPLLIEENRALFLNANIPMLLRAAVRVLGSRIRLGHKRIRPRNR